MQTASDQWPKGSRSCQMNIAMRRLEFLERVRACQESTVRYLIWLPLTGARHNDVGMGSLVDFLSARWCHHCHTCNSTTRVAPFQWSPSATCRGLSSKCFKPNDVHGQSHWKGALHMYESHSCQSHADSHCRISRSPIVGLVQRDMACCSSFQT